MKKFFRHGAAFFMAVGLILTSSSASSDLLGSKLRGQAVAVAPGVTITDQTFWSTEYSDLRSEYYAEYTPGSGVLPIVSYGDYVKSQETLEEMAASLESEGMRVVAGINTNFYQLKNGVPIGLVVSDGIIRSAIPNYESLGFKSDGTAIIGVPNVSITARWSAEEDGSYDNKSEQKISFAGFNKVREDGGYYLYSDEFWVNTLNNVTGTDIILRPLEGENKALSVTDSLNCEVVRIRDSKDENSIPADCFVISINNNSPEEKIERLSSLEVGTQVTLESTIDPEWKDVVNAVGGLYTLVKDGQISQGLSDSIKPCTAVGVRADGTVIFYAVDGRQSGHSIGANYEQVARRLIELGCISAFAMDGGGSTSFGTTYADDQAFRIINRPSDGAPRSVSVCLFLVSEVQPTNSMRHYYITSDHNVILSGSTMLLRVTAVDSNYYPMDFGGSLFWQSGLGRVSEDSEGNYLFTAGDSSGFDTVFAYNKDGVGFTDIVVVNDLSSLTLHDERSGTSLSALAVAVNETVDLSVVARYFNMKVTTSDADFIWTVDGPVGTVDENGLFTASHYNCKGSLTVSRDDISVTIPVVVTGGTPFVDINDHWGEEYIVQLYALGITNGFTDQNGRSTFLPDQSITRGELFTMVVRMLGVDVEKYEDLDLPFADADTLPEWILPYVKAAYGLDLLRGDLRDGQLYADIDGLVSRETAMVVFNRTMNISLPADLSGFGDSDQISDWAKDSLQTLVALGVVGGDDNLMLNPGKNALRCEVAKIIVSMLALPKT